MIFYLSNFSYILYTMEEVKEVKDLAEIKEKVKKPRSQKQIEAFEKAKQNRLKSIEIKKLESKKLLEDKILSKAISIKKKQIRKQFKNYNLDSISDDETPIEEIKEKHRAMTPPPIRPVQHISNPIVGPSGLYTLQRQASPAEPSVSQKMIYSFV